LDTPATSNGEKKDEANKQPQLPGKSNGAGTRSMMEPEMDIPANKENWVRVTRASIHHERNGDITGICFSPDSQFIASVSMYETMVVSRADNGNGITDKRHHAYSMPYHTFVNFDCSGKRLWTKSSYRHFANGITWDPRGKYLITLSTDRRMDVLDAHRGTMLRCCYQAELPTTRLPSTNDNTEIVQQVRLFVKESHLLCKPHSRHTNFSMTTNCSHSNEESSFPRAVVLSLRQASNAQTCH
jgi:WD40 repeat protein